MSEILTMQDLANGHLDVKALGEAANGDENTIVTTRTGKTYPSAERAINIMFQNGGLPATPFATKALMTASALIDGAYAVVTNDVSVINNGLYQKQGGTWVYAKYNPLSQIDNINKQVTRFVSGDENNPKPYIEQTRNTGGKIYVKVARIYITATASFSGAYYTWDNIKTDINNPALFVTSEIGTPDCLVLKDQSLVFDYTDSKFKVITRNLVDSSKHLNLVTGTLGKAVSGKLKEQWLNLRNDDIESTSFYMDVGEQVGSTPYVEQAVVGNVPYRVLYLKIDNIRLRGRGVNAAKTWANIIAEINRPDLIVTSQKGEPNCLKLSDQILVYNLETKTFAVRDTNIADKYNEIVFANVIFGQLIDGIIFDWWMNKRVNKLELSGGSGSGAAVASTLPAPSPQTRLLAHGGFHGNNQLAPFNTLPAFVLAGRYGFWGIETDLVETKDGEWVLSHDLTLDAYTNGTGLIKDYTLAELKLLDASKYANASGWFDVPLCTLDECLEVCVQYNMTPVLEFKSVPTKAGVEKVINTIKKYMPITNAMLTSTFDTAPLNTIRTVSAEMPIMYNVGAITNEHILSAKGLGNCVLSGQRTKNTDALYLQVRNAGLQAATWTLIQAEINKGLTSGCQYATTDHGVAANFDKGLITYSFANDSTYSNMTSIGAGTATNKVLTIPSGQAYIEIAVKKGDVITASFLARSGAAASSVAIECITGVDTVHRNYSENTVTSGTFKAHALSAVVYDNVTKVRLTFKAGTNGMAVRDIKINKREV